MRKNNCVVTFLEVIQVTFSKELITLASHSATARSISEKNEIHHILEKGITWRVVAGDQVEIGTSVSSRDNIPELACFDVFRVDGPIIVPPETNTSPEAVNAVESLDDSGVFKAAQEAMMKITVVWDQSNATGFLLLPNICLTNHHVAQGGLLECIQNTTAANHNPKQDECKWHEQSIQFSGDSLLPISMKSGKVLREYHHEKNPVLGRRGDFQFLDETLVKLSENVQTRVLFVPSPEVPQVGDSVVTFSFPGSLESPEAEFEGHPCYRKLMPELDIVQKVLHQFGFLCASYGKVIPPYGLNGERWIPVTNHLYDHTNQSIILSDECLTVGSSGGCLVCLEKCSPPKIVNGFTLVADVKSVWNNQKTSSSTSCLIAAQNIGQFARNVKRTRHLSV